MDALRVDASAGPRYAAVVGLCVTEASDVLAGVARDGDDLDLPAPSLEGVEQQGSLHGPCFVELTHEASATRGRGLELRFQRLVHDAQRRPRRVAYGVLRASDLRSVRRTGRREALRCGLMTWHPHAAYFTASRRRLTSANQ